ncbi:MAG: non-lysosomal glucosylceramidase [Candidatus Omnitrophica bacterium]|jgi:uncharacterized protein (DUF608 family)|nr:non-lysosomal glucosylceramidase [Candidatus Omnitrophota bacterium]
MQKDFSKKELLETGPQKILKGRNLEKVLFPLGGIGTGMVCLSGWGSLAEWQIMNRPSKGLVFEHSFFTLKINNGNKPIVKVLHGPSPVYEGNGHTAPNELGQNFPHFNNVSFTGSFPFAKVMLEDDIVPLKVSLEAFNPFIPLNDKDSSIPIAILIYKLKNRTNKKITGTIFGNLPNIIGGTKKERKLNVQKKENELTGLFLTATEIPEDMSSYGNMTLCTSHKNARVWQTWKYDDNGHPDIKNFWETITESNQFPKPAEQDNASIGTVAADFVLPSGKEIEIPFFITWYFPVFENYWDTAKQPCCDKNDSKCCSSSLKWKNYYATMWKDSWDAAIYTREHFERLYKETKVFHDSFFNSSLPVYVLDAVSSNISILKTPTCLRLEDGTFYGFEGCSNDSGCCVGSCTHVWNYAQALAWLFPKLQRSMREVDYQYAMREDGMIHFRLLLPLKTKPDYSFFPAADGQFGGIIQVYREWLISGDDDWLKKMWPDTKKSLEYAYQHLDANRDGIVEGVQHNTYDIEFYGPNTVIGSLYLAALQAAEKIAEYLGENEKAKEYKNLFLKGSKWTDENLFNGEYYEQKVLPDAYKTLPENLKKITGDRGRDNKFPWPKFQYGKGCMSDQLIGQWYARMLNMKTLYSAGNVKKTMKSIFRYNWKTDFTNHVNLNVRRTYAANNECGLLVCTWPKGDKPEKPVLYADEVWTGIEYQVASHLIYENFVEEGLTIVLGARKRYDGEKRNPWDEFECGHYYARAMSGYALIPALSGFFYSAPEKTICFKPKIFTDDFRSFFSVGSGWGVFRQKKTKQGMQFSFEILYGTLEISTIILSSKKSLKTINISFSNKSINAKIEQNEEEVKVIPEIPLEIKKGKKLKVCF